VLRLFPWRKLVGIWEIAIAESALMSAAPSGETSGNSSGHQT
jgi:hypothetical protein